MPLVSNLISVDKTPGYCWKCHKYQYESVTRRLWKSESYDEPDEYRSCLCPDCGDDLELDIKCDICQELADDGAIEVVVKKKTLLLCPNCYLIFNIERTINDLLCDTYLDRNEILSRLETIIKLYFSRNPLVN